MMSVGCAWILFFFVSLLVVESHRGMQRLHALVPECFGLNPDDCTCLEETFQQLSEKWFFHGGIAPAGVGGSESEEEAKSFSGKDASAAVRRRKSTFVPHNAQSSFSLLALEQKEELAAASSSSSQGVEMTAAAAAVNANDISVKVEEEKQEKDEKDEKEEKEEKEKGHVVVKLTEDAVPAESIQSPALSPSRSNKKQKEIHHSKSLMSFVAAHSHDIGNVTRFSPKTLSTMSGLIM